MPVFLSPHLAGNLIVAATREVVKQSRGPHWDRRRLGGTL
jgi:hypothetical protein